MRPSSIALAGLLAAGLQAGGPNAAALQGIDAAIAGTKQAIEQVRAAGGDTSVLEANLRNFEAQRKAMTSSGGEGMAHVSGGMTIPGAPGAPGAIQVTGKGGPDGGSGTVNVGGAVEVTGKGGPHGGSGTVSVGGIQVEGAGGPGGGSGTVTLPGGMTIQGGTTTGGSTAFPPGQSPAGVGGPGAAGWMEGMEKAMKAMAGGAAGTPGAPGKGAMAAAGPFTGSLLALQSGFAMLQAYDQPTADLEKRVKALVPSAKELDSLMMKMTKYAAEGKEPPPKMEARFDALIEKVEPELDSISEEMDSRSEAMSAAMENEAAAMEMNLDSSSEAMERALKMQEKMLEAQERMLESMGDQ